MRAQYWAVILWDEATSPQGADWAGPFDDAAAAREKVLELVEAYGHLVAGRPFAAFITSSRPA